MTYCIMLSSLFTLRLKKYYLLCIFIISFSLFSCNKRNNESEVTDIPIEKRKFPYCGVNYYPQHHAWAMWESSGWNSATIPSEINMELVEAKKLGITMTRIFINYSSFGKEAPSFNTQEVTYLKKYLDIVKGLNIGVVITLFDDCKFNGANVFSGINESDTQIVSVQNATTHVKSLAKLFKDYDNIIAWDLINEPDVKGFFDFSKGQWHEAGLNWLATIFNALKSDLNERNSSQRITFGSVMGVSIMTMVKDKFPGLLPQIHQYSPYNSSIQFYNKVTLDINDLYRSYGEPIFIGEFGSPADISDPEAIEKQANIYKVLLKAVNDNVDKVHSVANWTLYDFSGVNGNEGLFGIITTNREIKEAGDILQGYYQDWK